MSFSWIELRIFKRLQNGKVTRVWWEREENRARLFICYFMITGGSTFPLHNLFLWNNTKINYDINPSNILGNSNFYRWILQRAFLQSKWQKKKKKTMADKNLWMLELNSWTKKKIIFFNIKVERAFHRGSFCISLSPASHDTCQYQLVIGYYCSNFVLYIVRILHPDYMAL